MNSIQEALVVMEEEADALGTENATALTRRQKNNSLKKCGAIFFKMIASFLKKSITAIYYHKIQFSATIDLLMTSNRKKLTGV